jgi:phosphoglycerate kinase
MKTLKDFNFKGKRALVRCDFNVPLSQKQGDILDDFRIKETIPTINCLIEKGAKLILMSHLGRPGGKVIEGLRLTQVQNRLMESLDLSITKAPDCVGSEIEKWTRNMQPGEILLLENLRFHKEEEEGDLGFAQELAKMGDIFVNDAFGASHRAHASISGVPQYLDSGAGLLLEKEIKVLTGLIDRAERPLVAVIGGKKAETKAKLIDRISEKGDWVLIGGLIQREMKEKNIQLKHPQKVIEPVDEIEGKDIGPETVKVFKEKLKLAKTVIWSGPLGMIEKEEFSEGSKEISRAISESNAFSVVGGGETVEFINRLNLTSKFSHVSTGGGAMLAFLAGEKLPGLEALK